jgi:hypothetical protein
VRLAVGLTLLLLLLAGCGGGGGGSTGAAPDPSASGGETEGGGADLQTIEVESAGFELGVPASWKGLSGDDFSKSDALEEFSRENPSLAPYLSALQGGDSPMKLLAADPELESGFATNVNVLLQTVPDGTSAEEYAQLNRSGITSSLDLDGEIESEPVHHPAGDAAVARYRANLTAAGEKKTFSFVQYYFVQGTNAYVVTYTTVPEAEERYSADFEQSAGSFRFL